MRLEEHEHGARRLHLLSHRCSRLRVSCHLLECHQFSCEMPSILAPSSSSLTKQRCRLTRVVSLSLSSYPTPIDVMCALDCLALCMMQMMQQAAKVTTLL